MTTRTLQFSQSVVLSNVHTLYIEFMIVSFIDSAFWFLQVVQPHPLDLLDELPAVGTHQAIPIIKLEDDDDYNPK
jgi:hypothetical protein